ncbi:hypothetical protein B0S93_1131 [Caldicellulosiruptor bescii]|uniref:Polysaccharide biosynthesis protein n=1 Tax=Caldicellulosiruptor bescii TaxID=31899 RepID=A0ABY1S4S1_CALBS|nr:hypothetical protein [Caldicellulosiruptor bescii]PFH17310.1 hypothetical protein B0S93_1131 [Caldicellulosiruptor bescii]SKC44081.1 hypothetical protein SAMN05216512_0183 [Caldicellulosiruptor bescii]SLL39638.1 hypothetical protein SAMN05216181_2270 [Caldicellulosiruptor bescii]SMR90407.1 hypothetical protein SAMN04515609_2453 [Caldicellulosiruptor bescii]SMR90888.1 hypothetical protein SAMN05216240_0103 [Caldicellulosiruptor bescii]
MNIIGGDKVNERNKEIAYIILDLFVAAVPFLYITYLYRLGVTELESLKEVVYANSLLSTLFYISNIVMFLKIEYNISFYATAKVISVISLILGIILQVLYPSYGWAISILLLMDSFVVFLRGTMLREKNYMKAALINFLLHTSRFGILILFPLDGLLTRWIVSNIGGYLLVLAMYLSLIKWIFEREDKNSIMSLNIDEIRKRAYYLLFVMIIFVIQNIDLLALKGMNFYNLLVLSRPWGLVAYVVTVSIGNLVLINKKTYPYWIYLTVAWAGIFIGYISLGKHINYYLFKIPYSFDLSILPILFYLLMATILFTNYLNYAKKKQLIIEPLCLFLLIEVLKNKISLMRELKFEVLILILTFLIIVHLFLIFLYSTYNKCM